MCAEIAVDSYPLACLAHLHSCFALRNAEAEQKALHGVASLLVP